MNRRKPSAIGDHEYRAKHDTAWNINRAHQVKRASQQQAGSQARLRTQSLLVEKIGQARRSVQVQAAAGGDERQSESEQEGQQNPHRTAEKQCSVPKTLGSLQGSGMKLEDCGHSRSQADRDDIQDHPELGRAASRPRGAARDTRFPFGRQSQGRRQPLPKIRTRHKRNADLKLSEAPERRAVGIDSQGNRSKAKCIKME